MPRVFSGKVIFFFLVLLALDLSFMPLLTLGTFRPTLLYLMVPYAAFEWQGAKTIQTALLAGILRDLVSGLPLGVETVVLTASAVCLENFVQKIDRDSLLARFALSFLFLVSVYLLPLIFSGFLGFELPFSWAAFARCLGTAVWTVAFLPGVFLAADRSLGKHRLFKQYELFG